MCGLRGKWKEIELLKNTVGEIIHIILSTLLISPAIAPVGTSYAPGTGPRVPPGPMTVTFTLELGWGMIPVRRKFLAKSPAAAAGGGTENEIVRVY